LVTLLLSPLPLCCCRVSAVLLKGSLTQSYCRIVTRLAVPLVSKAASPRCGVRSLTIQTRRCLQSWEELSECGV